MEKITNKTILLWVFSAILLVSFALLLYISQGISKIDTPTVAVEVVLIGIIMAFVSFVLGKLDKKKQ